MNVKNEEDENKQVLLIKLSLEDAKRIISLMENPPEPNAAMQKAARTHQRLFSD